LIRITKTYGYFVRNKIESGINEWLSKRMKGKFKITKKELDEKNMMVRITAEFEKSADAWDFRILRLPVDLFRDKWERVAKRKAT